jgi:hypothetical protein
MVAATPRANVTGHPIMVISSPVFRSKAIYSSHFLKGITPAITSGQGMKDFVQGN